ncbi:unnamed protein product [Caenorhabditis sp. 36 PRJEB53466]|nr:unnamed protein product [Caenorhabditis sp. 36 PRJEB53466]
MSQTNIQSQDTYLYHPYRQRKNSTTSTYSDCSSASSGSPSSSSTTSSVFGTSPPVPYHSETTVDIYDRLKQYISEMPKDPIVCQILLDSLAQVIELERQLASLERQTQHLKMRQTLSTPTISLNSSPSSAQMTAKWQQEKVPEDLANVDVTEFKHLVHSAPLIYDSISY